MVDRMRRALPADPRVLAGAGAGLVAGALIGALRAGQPDPAPGIAELSPDGTGLLAWLVIGPALGIVLARLTSRGRGTGPATAATGVLLGLILWVTWSLSALPLLAGQAPQWTAELAIRAYGELVAATMFGGLSALILIGLTPLVSAPVARGRQAEPEPERPRIVILGAGFAGVSAARRLESLAPRRARWDVTLVSRSNYLLFTPMLAEVASGAIEAQHIGAPIRVACPRTRFLRGEALDVDLDRRCVRVGVGQRELELPYDHLVLALGSEPSFRELPGLAEHALTLKSLGDAIAVRNLLVHSRERILPEVPPSLADFALRRLRERGIELRLGVRVAGAGERGLRLEGGETIDAGTVVWTAGNQASRVVRALPLEKGPAGALKVDATLRVAGRDEVWAIGDLCGHPRERRGASPSHRAARAARGCRARGRHRGRPRGRASSPLPLREHRDARGARAPHRGGGAARALLHRLSRLADVAGRLPRQAPGPGEEGARADGLGARPRVSARHRPLGDDRAGRARRSGGDERARRSRAGRGRAMTAVAATGAMARRARADVGAGALAGVAGGLAFGAAMVEQGGMLPTIAGIVRSGAPLVGFLVHMAIAAVIGAGFGVFVGRERVRAGETLIWGVSYGAFWWFLGALTLLPLLSGEPVLWTMQAAQAGLPSLVGHLVYGVVTAAALVLVLGRRQGPLVAPHTVPASALVRGIVAGAVATATLLWILTASRALLAESGLAGGPRALLWLAGLATGAASGAAYAALYPRPRGGGGPAMIRGLAYGLLWWVGIGVTAVPLLAGDGLAWNLEEARARASSLPGFALAGLVLVVLYRAQSALVGSLFEDDPRADEDEGAGTRALRALAAGTAAGLAGDCCSPPSCSRSTGSRRSPVSPACARPSSGSRCTCSSRSSSARASPCSSGARPSTARPRWPGASATASPGGSSVVLPLLVAA